HVKSEIKKDFEYLVKLWNEIRENTLKSEAPSLIYEEASIIKRSIRDLYSRDIESIYIEGEDGYKIAKTFVKKLLPGHIKKVKLYDDKEVSLFSKFKINDQIDQIYSTRVNLPSGGYLVINTTEALISIDVNSGKSTRERNVSGTALKTNLEAANEIAKQCRLRDLAGLIVIDFIDMEDKRDNLQVEKCLRYALREDKAKIQIGIISNFGLLELARQRLRSSIADANMITCSHCNGTGQIWSDEAVTIRILRKIEEICTSLDFQEILVTLSTDVALYIINNKRSYILDIENQRNAKIIFRIDPSFSATDFKIESIKKYPTTDDEDSSHQRSAQPHEVVDNISSQNEGSYASRGKNTEDANTISEIRFKKSRFYNRGRNRQKNYKEQETNTVVPSENVEKENIKSVSEPILENSVEEKSSVSDWKNSTATISSEKTAPKKKNAWWQKFFDEVDE
ncbi:MAG: ribonuclease E/G, partial [Holosporaceae bacterium]|nr:ribonuclease E/G [Holosporaceae bacterium]